MRILKHNVKKAMHRLCHQSSSFSLGIKLSKPPTRHNIPTVFRLSRTPKYNACKTDDISTILLSINKKIKANLNTVNIMHQNMKILTSRFTVFINESTKDILKDFFLFCSCNCSLVAFLCYRFRCFYNISCLHFIKFDNSITANQKLLKPYI